MAKKRETRKHVNRSRGQQKRRKEEAVADKERFSQGVRRFPRLECPKCKSDGRKKCTRFHMVEVAGRIYIRCEQSICGWMKELAET